MKTLWIVRDARRIGIPIGLAGAAALLIAFGASAAFADGPPVPTSVHFDSSPATVTLALPAEEASADAILYRLDGRPYFSYASGAPTGTIVVTGTGGFTVRYFGRVTGPPAQQGPMHTLIVTIGHSLETSGTWFKANPTTVRRGRSAVLQGSLGAQPTLVGSLMRVLVKKPGRAYWSYSSSRRAYDQGGLTRWWYRYWFRPGMPLGNYSFYSVFPGNNSVMPWTSPTVTVKVIR